MSNYKYKIEYEPGRATELNWYNVYRKKGWTGSWYINKCCYTLDEARNYIAKKLEFKTEYYG